MSVSDNTSLLYQFYCSCWLNWHIIILALSYEIKCSNFMCALVNLVRSNSEFDVVLCIILWSVGPVLIHRATNKTCIILLYTSIHLLVCTSKEHNIIHE